MAVAVVVQWENGGGDDGSDRACNTYLLDYFIGYWNGSWKIKHVC